MWVCSVISTCRKGVKSDKMPATSDWCIILLVTVSCFGLGDSNGDEPKPKTSSLRDPRRGTLLEDAHYVKVMSDKMGYSVFSKWGGYGKALHDFSSLPVTEYLKEWDDGSMAAFLGNNVIILMRGPYPGHAWITLRSRANKDKIISLIWYMPLPKELENGDAVGEAEEDSE